MKTILRTADESEDYQNQMKTGNSKIDVEEYIEPRQFNQESENDSKRSQNDKNSSKNWRSGTNSLKMKDDKNTESSRVSDLSYNQLLQFQML